MFVGPPGEFGNLEFIDFVTLVWDPLPEALIYNTYRRVMPAFGGLGSMIFDPYDHFCIESDDEQQNGAMLTVDDVLFPGVALYYLVDGELACGDGTLGTASNGTLRPRPFPCPTPPP